MPDRLRVELYCLCWNDARMLPFFFRHYDQFVDRYFIYDNGSTDASLSLMHRHGGVKIAHFDVEGNSFVAEERRLGDTIWKGSKADWVIVTDIDEHIFHPDLPGYLRRCTEQGVTAIQSIGFEMVAESFPRAGERLTDAVTTGARSAGHDRLCIFNPQALTETNFTPGRHRAVPQGNVVWPDYPEVLLLHYKQLGVDYAVARSAELMQGLKPGDVEKGWGFQYAWDREQIRANWENLKGLSGLVPGLGVLRHVAPEDYNRVERTLIRSGLIDREWYLKTYPDINPVEVDPLLHYCIHGRKEGRRPNFYFDAGWYAGQYPELAAEEGGALYSYITAGERAGAMPSPHFDPAWYREAYGLSPDVSPLAHYLAHRRAGGVSPLGSFDVAGFCARHPEAAGGGLDPYEYSCLLA